jgi:hyperosmotically inducible protein
MLQMVWQPLVASVKMVNANLRLKKAAAEVKGVKSVINNSTIAPPPAPPTPPPASMTTVLDEATQQKVKDGLKDIPGVTVEFVGDKAVLSGAVTKADRKKIMQMLASAKVKSM